MKSPDGGCVIEYIEVVGDTLDLSVTYEDKFERPFDLTDSTATLDIYLPDVATTVPLLSLPVITGNSQRNLDIVVSSADTTELGKGVFRSQLKLVDSVGRVNSLVLGKITLVDPNSSSLRLPNKLNKNDRVILENGNTVVREVSGGGNSTAIVTTVTPAEIKPITFVSVAAVVAGWLVVIIHEDDSLRKSVISSTKLSYEEESIQGSNITALAFTDLVNNRITLFVENRSSETVSVRAKLIYFL